MLKNNLPWNCLLFIIHKRVSHFSKATKVYASEVRLNIGNGNFSALFDLANSSALAILIDTSGSMSDEIEAVKAEVIEIIEVKRRVCTKLFIANWCNSLSSL